MSIGLAGELMQEQILRKAVAFRDEVVRRASDAHAYLTRRIVSPRRLISRLGIITTCITMFLPPLAFALLALYDLKSDANEQAAIGARHFEMQMTMDRSRDAFQHISNSIVHITTESNIDVAASWLTYKDGRIATFHGVPVHWPEVWGSAPIHTAEFDGQFHVALSMRRVFVATSYVSLAFLLLGIGAYYCFRRLPLATLDDALEQLQSKQEELLSQKQKVEVQNLRFDTALNNMSQGLSMFDGERRLVVCNARYAQMYDIPAELTAVGTPLSAILDNRFARSGRDGPYPEEYVRDLAKLIAANRVATRVIELKDGRVYVLRHQPMPGGGWVAMHEDITEQRRIEARVAHLANHDTLTDLPNRLHLRERLSQELDKSEGDATVAVLSLDLDRFKDINDSLGHAAGDEILKTVGQRLRDCVRGGDVVARLGADEFAILQIGAEQPIAATALATRVLDAISAPYTCQDQPVELAASIGISVSPADGRSTDELIQNADLARHLAKEEGRGTYRFFEPATDAHMQARRRLQLDLHKALVNGEFELNYQPVVNLERYEISGMEALLRWNHPERGRVPPAEFVPLAEENGQIVAIGAWALRQACTDAADWPEHVKVAVNLSAVQFRNRNLVDTVFSVLSASGLPAHRLELEVTESVLLQNNEQTLATLHQLRALGVRIAMDDFGTGYSSLSYLRSFPFDKIKIDRCFVSDIADAGADSHAILRAVASLGISLGIATTAEGVETKEQVERVRQEGCTEMQGYYFSPPRPIAEIRKLLDDEQRATSAA
jgi:diguanylate cyclase (GGDEF)-like protein